MLKNRHEQIQIVVRLTDAVVCIVAFLAAYWLRSSPSLFPGSERIASIGTLSWMLAASLTLHFILYPIFRFYESLRLRSIRELILMIVKAAFTEFFVIGTLVFILQYKLTSRSFFALFLGINYALLALEKIGGKILLSSVRMRGYNYRQLGIVGCGPNAARLISALQKNKHWGYIPSFALRVGSQAPKDPGSKQEIEGIPILGDLKDLAKLVQERTLDEVYFAPDVIDSAELSDSVALCETLGIPARLTLGLFDLPKSRITYTVLDGVPVLTFYTALLTPFEAMTKRLMDIVISSIGLGITLVVGPWIVWRIKKESPGPAIFKQVRVGENGRRFKCYKFRTMYLDAEKRKAELMAKNEMQGPMFKMEDDPRITPFGAFLRKTSLDELPQFFNILRGDMSVVGTRPPTPDEVVRYETHYRRRLSIRPGLTGLWQVSGRNQITRFEDVLELDLKYIDSRSLWLDLKIITQTIWVALFGRGAY